MKVRYARQTATCLQLAQRLQALPQVEAVDYTGLEPNPFWCKNIEICFKAETVLSQKMNILHLAYLYTFNTSNELTA